MPERAKKVGLFLSLADNQYQRLLAKEACDAARHHGLELDISYSENLASQQSQDIVRFLHTNPDRGLCVVVLPVADIDSAAQGSVTEHPVHLLGRRVAAKGVGWIILNRDAEVQVSALRQEFPSLPVGLVTPDQKEFGRIQGRQFRALLPQGGRVLYVLGNPHVSSARDRRLGMLEQTAGAPFEFHELNGMWSAEKAREAVNRWLRSPTRQDKWPDLVGCQNDEMGLGAREALAEAARELNRPALVEVPVTGGDGLPEGGQRWVAEKKLAATVIVPSTSRLAIDLLAEAWVSRQPMPLKTVLKPSPFPPLTHPAGSY